MTAIPLLRWSLRLDFEFLFRIPGLPFAGKLRFVLLKYLLYARDRWLAPAGGSHRSITVFGRPFHYSDPFGPASLQRVYCSSYRLKQLLPPAPVIVDVGANVGQFNFFCRQYLEARRVLSVEPVKECFELLRLNAGADDLCYNQVVGDGVGEVVFHVCARSSQLSSYVRDASETYLDSYSVASRRMDDLFAESGLEQVDLFKVDTEGSEFDVLRCAQDTLAGSEFLLVEMSIFRASSGSIFRTGRLLEEHGYHLVELTPTSGYRPNDTDAIFRNGARGSDTTKSSGVPLHGR